MKREDLFLAIGEVEESRLMRTELTVECPSEGPEREEQTMKKHTRTTSVIRRILIAAVIVSTLAVTAFAVSGFLLFDSPAQMLHTLFGDQTGYDHSDGSITRDPYGGPEAILVEPTFDRVPVDETVATEDIAPYISPVGQSITNGHAVLTVDAYVYDSVTRCGLLTYTLDDPDGVSYELQTNGEIWYYGVEPLHFNQSGESYIITEKTTDTTLAATYYFQYDHGREDTLEISFREENTITDEELYRILEELHEQVRQDYPADVAIQMVKEKMGAARFAEYTGDGSEAEAAYVYLAEEAYAQQEEQREAQRERITVPFSKESVLNNVTAQDGSVTVTPICIQIDITDLTFLHTARTGEPRVHADNVDSVVIRYQDGTEYIVEDGYVMNHLYSLISSASEGKEDTSNLLTYIFNRLINVDAIQCVVINGTELPVD